MAIDASRAASGCSAVALQGLTLELSADLTLIADSLKSTNGLTVTSADGFPHSLRILTPGEVGSGPSAASIALLGGTTADNLIAVEIGTPGTLTLSGGVTMLSQVTVGALRADGRVASS